MSNQQVRPSIIALLVSASITVFASLGCEGVPRDEDIAPDEVATADEDRKWPEGLTVFDVAGRNYGYDIFSHGDYNAHFPLPSDPAELEHQALLDSLSPGVRARYEGWLLDDEAEYIAFIDERLRRLNEDRPSRK